MSRHAKEPWKASECYVCTMSSREIADCDSIDETDCSICQANAARIVACVNALAGVPDPAAVAELVEAARGLNEPMRRYMSHLTWTSGDEQMLIDAAIALRAALAKFRAQEPEVQK